MRATAGANHDTNRRTALSESPTETSDIKGSRKHSGTRNVQEGESFCSASDAEESDVSSVTPQRNKAAGSSATRTTSTGGHDASDATPPNKTYSRSGAQKTPSATLPPSLEKLFAKANQTELFQFMHTVNELYQTHLNKQPPFARFILLGLQSTGKSTVVERLIKFPMNIVAEGTGTRCPLYITCINDPKQKKPRCDITGCTSCPCSTHISHRDVFNVVTKHNQDHVIGAFSATPLRLSVRSAAVQNLIFVDLPGIILTQNKGKDMRKSIKDILRHEIDIPNTKLLVLLEPKEYATNSIIEFIDDAIGARDEWLPRAIFLMTKFDLRIPDSLTGSKSNRFFDEFWDNDVKPYMVITPTMQRAADTFGSAEEQYKERERLIKEADNFEKEQSNVWRSRIEKNYRDDKRNELLGTADRPYSEYAGFNTAVKEMYNCILKDTFERLPEVVKEINHQLNDAEEELNLLEQTVDADFFSEVIHHLVEIIHEYLNGSFRIATKMETEHRTLKDEIDDEVDSEWSTRPLNHLGEEEHAWRAHICKMFDRNAWPEHVQPMDSYLGGKQYQRAIVFFRAIMVERLPDPHELRSYVASATGALRDGLMMESWEHATVEIIKHCVRGVAEAGINYFIKHALAIFRRLIRVALCDAKKGEKFSGKVRMMPKRIEEFIIERYDGMIWTLGMEAAESSHQAIVPYYSTVDPTLGNKTDIAMPLKPLCQLYKNVLMDNSVGKLFHFTDKRNLDSIRQMGGLFSNAVLQSLGIDNFPANDDATQKSDESHGLHKYIHLGFSPHNPICQAAQNEKRIGDCALLEIDPSVVTWRDTHFADRSIRDPSHKFGGALNDLKRIRFKDASMLHDEAGRDQTYSQAAVFVSEHIPIQYITIHPDAIPRKRGFRKKPWEKIQKNSKCESAKKRLKSDIVSRSLQPTEFLPGARCPLINKDEVECILDKSLDYILKVYDHILTCLNFHFNHYLYQRFKDKLNKDIGFTLAKSPELTKLAEQDTNARERCAELKVRTTKLREVLQAVRRLQKGESPSKQAGSPRVDGQAAEDKDHEGNSSAPSGFFSCFTSN